MRILAIDTSCGAASVAAFEGATRETLASGILPMRLGHAEALTPLVQRVMAEVDGGFSSLDAIAATIGPGSFTGIRIGLALARAFGVALDKPVIGVSTLVAFAAPLLADPRPGIIVAAIDARHGAVYHQSYEANGRPLFAPRVGAPLDAIRAVGAGPTRLAGDAAEILAAEARRVGMACEAYPAAYPDIVAVARVALASDPAANPPRPLYVKPPDAKPAAGEAIARRDN
jgi:tRNA threonylcarbamoyl adenosine modification protein YeaZ